MTDKPSPKAPPPQSLPSDPTGGTRVRIVTYGPTGLVEEPRANTVIDNVATFATGAVALGLLAAAAVPAGMTGAAALGAAAIGGVVGNALGRRFKLGEPDVLVRSGDGALYITVKFSPTHGHTFEQAVEEARKYALERQRVLYLGIRRTDLSGHPYVAQWQRTTIGEGFDKAEWMPGAFLEPAVATRADPVPYMPVGPVGPVGAVGASPGPSGATGPMGPPGATGAGGAMG